MNGITRKFLVAGAVALAGAIAAQGAQAAAPDVKLKVYGQVDRAMLWADDGNDSTTYFVDNSNSSTRFGFDAKAVLEGGLSVGAKFEAEFQSNASSDVNQIDQSTDATLKERHMDVWFENEFGKLSIGQGNMASNETSEVDLSGTAVIAYSDVNKLAGGIIFYSDKTKSLVATPAKPATANLTTGVVTPEQPAKYNPKVKDVFNNLDGLSRDDRVRYDTPTFAGFTLSASAGEKETWDAALRYVGDFGGTKVSAAVAYSDFGDQNQTVDGMVNGSASVVFPFGLSLTGAAGQQSLDEDKAKREDDPTFWYGKVAYTAKLFFAGSTTFGADYSETKDLKKDGDEAKTWAVCAVQRLDSYNTELYAGYRSYSLDRKGADYEDVTGLMAGARVKF